MVGADALDGCGSLEKFIGPYRTYSNPIMVENGKCDDSMNFNSNACGALRTEITLQPGECREVSFTIDKEMISFYRQDMTWGPEPGDFKVFIGGSSDNVKEASFGYEI
jgi:hypothetical protein